MAKRAWVQFCPHLFAILLFHKDGLALYILSSYMSIDNISLDDILLFMKRSMQLLPQLSFSILMALSLKPRHGYEIMAQVKEDSLGKINIGPGSLYTAIKQLSEDGLIKELVGADERRRYYQLSKKGAERLNAELEYFANTIELAKQRKVFEPLRLPS